MPPKKQKRSKSRSKSRSSKRHKTTKTTPAVTSFKSQSAVSKNSVALQGTYLNIFKCVYEEAARQGKEHVFIHVSELGPLIFSSSNIEEIIGLLDLDNAEMSLNKNEALYYRNVSNDLSESLLSQNKSLIRILQRGISNSWLGNGTEEQYFYIITDEHGIQQLVSYLDRTHAVL
jgi:hypothetical protein